MSSPLRPLTRGTFLRRLPGGYANVSVSARVASSGTIRARIGIPSALVANDTVWLLQEEVVGDWLIVASLNTTVGGFAVAASWDLHDSNTIYTTPSVGHFGGPNFGEGPFASFFDLPSSTIARIIGEGWYLLSVSALVTATAAGQVAKVECVTGLPQVCVGYAVSVGAETLVPQSATAPFYLYDPGDVPVSLQVNVSGTSGLSVTGVHLRLVRLTGVGPLGGG